MTELNPQFVAQVEKIRAALDELDYFQLLRVPYEANDVEIRAGYHRQAKAFHPDRYLHLGDARLTDSLTTIAKRVTEAYVILRDAARRAAYARDVQSAQRAQHLRFREAEEESERDRARTQTGSTAQGQKLFAQAQAAHQRGDVRGALQSLRMALVYEPQNAAFSEKLAAWTAELGE